MEITLVNDHPLVYSSRFVRGIRTILMLIFVFLPTQNLIASQELSRDPTRPLVTNIKPSTDKTQPLTLQSIVFSPTRQIAIINYQTVKIGDTVENAKVLTIRKNLVILLTQEGKVTLYLFDSSGFVSSVSEHG